MSEEKKVGYVAQFSGAISQDGMNVSFNFNMPENATKEQFSEKIDLLRSVVERQRARSEVKLLEAMMVEKEAALRNMKFDLGQYLKRHDHSVDDEHAVRTQARIDEMVIDLENGRNQLDETRANAV